MSSDKDNFKLLEKALKLVPKIVAKKTKAAKRQQAMIDLFKTVSKEILKASKENEKRRKLLQGRKQHPWRICPIGEHWVSDHQRRYKPDSKNYPGTYPVSGTCRTSPTAHDYLDASEIQLMSEQRIKESFPKPNSPRLGFDDPRASGDMYDDLIGLWTSYWNYILEPNELLDPNFVKALIATESSFQYWAKAKVPRTKNVFALGLMQVRDDYAEILKSKGELKDYFLKIEKEDLYLPAVGIATGVRWLFHKRDLIQRKQKRKLSWKEIVLHYKGFVNPDGSLKKKAQKEYVRFMEYYNELVDAKGP